MVKSHLIEVLRTFTPREIKEFADFVRSPFFNKNENVINLYMYLKKWHPDFPENKIKKEEVHKKVFAGTKYKDGFMRKLIFNLIKLAEDYIGYKNTINNSVESGLDLLEELNNRNLGKLFVKHFNEISKDVEGSGNKDHIYYRSKYLLETTHTRYTDKIRYKVDLHDKKEYHNEKLRNKLFYFTNYFLLLSLDMYRTLKYQGYADRFEYNDEFLDNLISYLLEGLNETKSRPEGFTDNLTLKVYLYEIMLMRNKASDVNLSKDIYFNRLKEILRSETGNLSHDSRFSLYNILLQHCANRIIRGYGEYRNERLELDKIALKDGIYLSRIETEFPPPAFAAMVRDAAEMKEFGWAEEFIENNKTRLDSNNYDTVINLSGALVDFNKNKFKSALGYLNKIKPVKRWEFKFAVKELTLQVYYELSMFQQAYYLVDSFRHFITSMARNFSEERIESRNNFLKIFGKLLKMKENAEKEEITIIKKELKDTNMLIFNRDWLMEKAGELT